MRESVAASADYQHWSNLTLTAKLDPPDQSIHDNFLDGHIIDGNDGTNDDNDGINDDVDDVDYEDNGDDDDDNGLHLSLPPIRGWSLHLQMIMIITIIIIFIVIQIIIVIIIIPTYQGLVLAPADANS